MSKRFLVKPDYLARIGGCWYDHRVQMIVVEDERVEVYRRAAVGRPPTCSRSYGYLDLDPTSPPLGLSRVESHDGMPLSLSVVLGSAEK
jgi:hypothetical protein